MDNGKESFLGMVLSLDLTEKRANASERTM